MSPHHAVLPARIIARHGCSRHAAACAGAARARCSWRYFTPAMTTDRRDLRAAHPRAFPRCARERAKRAPQQKTPADERRFFLLARQMSNAAASHAAIQQRCRSSRKMPALFFADAVHAVAGGFH